MSHRLAIIADEPLEPALDELLPSHASFSHCPVRWNASALQQIRSFKPDLIIAVPPGTPDLGSQICQDLRNWDMAAPILLIFGSQFDPALLDGFARAADDFIFWPPRPDELTKRLTRLLGEGSRELDRVREQLGLELGMAQLVGQDPGFVEVIQQIPLLGRSDAPVLLLGETGTGKESCARALHHLGPRGSHPFIPVDCGALPEHLAENELFGHVRGAFTGAHTGQRGLAAMADGGTLFLDEVDSLSLPVQAKLLRFLEDHTYRPLGADRFSRADVRILAATNHDLEICVREKRFRQDLYFRLNVLQIRLPALRERRRDIALLARHFLVKLSGSTAAQGQHFAPSALRALEQYNWPGNIRELFNVVQRAYVLATEPPILPRHLALPASVGASSHDSTSFREGKMKAIASYERHYVEEMLRKHEGNITRAAREARQDRRAFGRLVKKLVLDRNSL